MIGSITEKEKFVVLTKGSRLFKESVSNITVKTIDDKLVINRNSLCWKKHIF